MVSRENESRIRLFVLVNADNDRFVMTKPEWEIIGTPSIGLQTYRQHIAATEDGAKIYQLGANPLDISITLRYTPMWDIFNTGDDGGIRRISQLKAGYGGRIIDFYWGDQVFKGMGIERIDPRVTRHDVVSASGESRGGWVPLEWTVAIEMRGDSTTSWPVFPNRPTNDAERAGL